MAAKVAFLTQEMPPGERAPRTVVQPAAIARKNGREVVYAVRDNKAVEIAVETGRRIGDMVEVVKGIQPGEKVVVKPLDRVHDGAKVSLQAK
jgi:multidrug efflux pump subunit AcrA (membrane-fusion protein)